MGRQERLKKALRCCTVPAHINMNIFYRSRDIYRNEDEDET